MNKKNVDKWTKKYFYNFDNNNYLQKHDENQYRHAVACLDTSNAHGNMTKMPHLQELFWDYKDNLKEVTLDLSGNKAYYVYDASGNRVRKVVIKNNGTIVEDRIYVNNYEIYRKTTNGTLNIERETLNIIFYIIFNYSLIHFFFLQR